MVFTYQQLYNAWRKTVVISSTEPNRVRFKYELEDNLIQLLNELQNGTFEPTALRRKSVMYPKKRIVQVPSIRDKIVQHVICDNYLKNALTRPLIKETAACMEGRGSSYAAGILRDQLRGYHIKHGSDFYALECDIHHFFDSLDHGVLFKIIDRYVSDEEVKTLMHKFINLSERGLALGLQQSQLLANLYLSGLDHMCKERLHAKIYGRYQDNFYIISDDREYLKKCLEKIKEYVESIGLTLNESTAISHNRISYLGFTYHISDSGKIIRILDKGKRKSKYRHIKKMLRELKDGKRTAEDFANSYAGWRVHALKGNCYSLVHKWDEWIKTELENMGYKMKTNKRKVTIYVKNN